MPLPLTETGPSLRSPFSPKSQARQAAQGAVSLQGSPPPAVGVMSPDTSHWGARLRVFEPSRARWPPHCPSHTPRAGGRQLPSPGAGARGGLCALLSPHTLPPAAVSLPGPGMADHVLTASAPATGRSRVVWGSAASPWASYILPKCPMTWLACDRFLSCCLSRSPEVMSTISGTRSTTVTFTVRPGTSQPITLPFIFEKPFQTGHKVLQF